MNTEDTPALNREIFEIERLDDTVVLTPTENMGELHATAVSQGLQHIRHELSQGEFRHVVLNFERTDYFGSTALNEFIRLWKDVSSHEGQLVFCGLSPHEREITSVAGLNDRWLICASRDEALERLKEATGNTQA